VDHDQKPGYEGHIVLKLTYQPLVQPDNGWADDMGAAGGCLEGEWHGQGAIADKGWRNDTVSAEQSWSAAGGSGMPMEKVWSYAGEKVWLNSTSTSVAPTEKGWPNGVGFDSSQLDPNDEDSLMMYGCGGDSSEFTSSSSTGEDHQSAYEHIHSSIGGGGGGSGSNVGFGLSELVREPIPRTAPRTENCVRHVSDALTHFCKTCETGVCDACSMRDGECTTHECVRLTSDSARSDCTTLLMIRDRARAKSEELNGAAKRVDDMIEGLKRGYQDDEQSIRNAFDCFLKALLDRRAESSAELRNVYSARMDRLNTERDTVMYNAEQLTEANQLIRTLLLLSGQKDLTRIHSRLNETLDKLFAYVPNIEHVAAGTINEISFVANQHAMQAAVRNTFGYLRHGPSGGGSCPSLVKKVTKSFVDKDKEDL